MKKLWMIFAQAVTVSLGVWVVVGLFRPEWGLPAQRLIPGRSVVTIEQRAGERTAVLAQLTYAPAAKKA